MSVSVDKKFAATVAGVALSVFSVLGVGFSAPALADEGKATSSFTLGQVASEPTYSISVSPEGGLISLAGAEAKVEGMNLSIVNSKGGEVLDILPEFWTAEDGTRFRYLYDISDPSNITFTMLPLSKNRFDFARCGLGASSVLTGFSSGLSAGAAMATVSLSTALKAVGPVGWGLLGAGALMACLASA